MKTTKLILFALIIFFGVILTDCYSKGTNTDNENSERPRRRVVYVKHHRYVKPVVYLRHHRYVKPVVYVIHKHPRKHYRKIVFVH